MNHYKLYIFDWDGTLMDSVARIVSSLQQAAISVGLPRPTEHSVKGIIGLSLPKAIDILFEQVSAPQEQELISQYKLQFREQNQTPSPMFDFAHQLLTLLTTNNKRLAVATGKGRVGLDSVLSISETEHYFHSSICADESVSKPAPDMLFHLLQHFGVQAHEAVMIGDSIHDLKMAQNAGVDAVGVTIGVDDAQTLEQYTPVAIVNSLRELHDLIESSV